MRKGHAFSQKAGRALRRASPTILTILSASGVVATAVLAVRATPKAIRLIREDSRVNHDGDPDAYTKAEAVSSCWRCYVPAMLVGTSTVMCIFGANFLNRKRQASLASAYALVSRSYSQYKEKVKELYGREAHDEIMSAIAAEKTEHVPITGSLSGGVFDFGEIDDKPRLFYDAFSDRYFESTFTQVALAELHVNRNFALGGGEISLSQFYDFLGLDTPPELMELGWYVSDYYIWIDFTHTKAMIDDGASGEAECWVIDMDFPPTPGPLDDC